jgi:hypothetical protein
MTWASAQAWIASLNTASCFGVNTWQLPHIIDTGTSGCNFGFTGTDCGHNVDLSTGEMAYLFYSTRGNLAYFSTSGTGPQPGWGSINDGPFPNLQPKYYWAGTTYGPDASHAWHFDFNHGEQGFCFKSADFFYAWAARDGDIVPVPAVVRMLGSALGVLGLMRRRIATGTAAQALPP